MKTTIPKDKIYILHRNKPEIDLKRSPKDYLDLREELQRHVNSGDDSYPVEQEIHVKSLLKDVHNRMTKVNEKYVLNHLVVSGKVNLFFSFGLPPHAHSVTMN